MLLSISSFESPSSWVFGSLDLLWIFFVSSCCPPIVSFLSPFLFSPHAFDLIHLQVKIHSRRFSEINLYPRHHLHLHQGTSTPTFKVFLVRSSYIFKPNLRSDLLRTTILILKPKYPKQTCDTLILSDILP